MPKSSIIWSRFLKANKSIDKGQRKELIKQVPKSQTRIDVPDIFEWNYQHPSENIKRKKYLPTAKADRLVFFFFFFGCTQFQNRTSEIESTFSAFPFPFFQQNTSLCFQLSTFLTFINYKSQTASWYIEGEERKAEKEQRRNTYYCYYSTYNHRD